ncbi:MAG: AcvB/VirJ family lysyl-phosphatidylglycerol hydrolase [Gemmatimonadota bacterium]|jgi:type IV secretory pathway VirJ component
MRFAIAVAASVAGTLVCCSPQPASPSGAGFTNVQDLPLVEVPVPDTTPGHDLAIFLSGDGGWAHLDKAVAHRLVDAGIPVVGFNSRDFLERRRTPEETAKAITRVIRHYSEAWGRDSLVLVGYSRGADILPFVVNLLPADLAARTRVVALLAPAERAGFKFRWIDLVVNTSSPDDLPIMPQVDSIAGPKVLCFYGKEEKESLCRRDLPPTVTVFPRNGGHHFDGNYDEIGDLILQALGR